MHDNLISGETMIAILQALRGNNDTLEESSVTDYGPAINERIRSVEQRSKSGGIKKKEVNGMLPLYIVNHLCNFNLSKQ